MEAEYPFVPLGEVAAVRSGYAFKSSDWTDSGVPVVKIANVKNGRLAMEGCSFVTTGVAAEAAEFTLCPDDVLIAMTGYIGDVAWVRRSDLPALINQRVGRVSIRDDRRLDRRFLFYLLRLPEIRREIEGLGYGSAQPNVSPSLIHAVEVPFPSLREQFAIAQVLGAFDDKIELNRRMNETLEGIARAIFMSWFVDFDPVRAKMEGRDPNGMNDTTAALFPDSLADSKLGPIPNGWIVKSIGDVVDVAGGSTPSTNEPAYWDGPHFFATPKDLSGLESRVLLRTDRTISDAGLRRISSGLLPRGTVLLSSRAPIGYVAISEIPVAVNQGFIAMVCNKDLPSSYVMQWASSNVEVFKQNAGGTTFAEINKRSFRPLSVLVPPSSLLNVYEEALKPLYERITASLRESETLIRLREALLPKLISGEIRIRDAEQMAEAAVGR